MFLESLPGVAALTLERPKEWHLQTVYHLKHKNTTITQHVLYLMCITLHFLCIWRHRELSWSDTIFLSVCVCVLNVYSNSSPI